MVIWIREIVSKGIIVEKRYLKTNNNVIVEGHLGGTMVLQKAKRIPFLGFLISIHQRYQLTPQYINMDKRNQTSEQK